MGAAFAVPTMDGVLAEVHVVVDLKHSDTLFIFRSCSCHGHFGNNGQVGTLATLATLELYSGEHAKKTKTEHRECKLSKERKDVLKRSMNKKPRNEKNQLGML